MLTLGIKLKTTRKELSLTLRQVEKSLTISNAYLSQLENDKIKNPSANVLYKLASLYCIPLNELLEAAGIIEKKEAKPDKHNELMQRIAFSSESMTDEEKEQVLNYLEFIKSQNKGN